MFSPIKNSLNFTIELSYLRREKDYRKDSLIFFRIYTKRRILHFKRLYKKYDKSIKKTIKIKNRRISMRLRHIRATQLRVALIFI